MKNKLKSETKREQFLELYTAAEANADSDVGRLMLWCDDNRHFLRQAVLDSQRMEWLERAVHWNDPTNTVKVVFNIQTVPRCTLRAAIDAEITVND